MKKNLSAGSGSALIILILTCCLMTASCSPLSIVMNTHTEDGDRIVLTSDKRLFGDISAALGARVAEKDTVLAILVTYDGRSDHGVFSKGDKMLVRLGDQSVITLENVYHKEFEEETVTNTTQERVSDFGYAYSYDPYLDDILVTPYQISHFIPRVTTSRITKSYALYFISKPQLGDIIEKGVIKLRVELEDSELDMPDTSKVPAVFQGMRDCLFDCLSKGIQRTEF